MTLDELFEDGKIVKGVNTTKDVNVNSIITQSKKSLGIFLSVSKQGS
jgi:hypothetical protein